MDKNTKIPPGLPIYFYNRITTPSLSRNVQTSENLSPSLSDSNAFVKLCARVKEIEEKEFLQSLKGKNFLGFAMFQLLTLLVNMSMGQGGRDDFKLRGIKFFGSNTFTIDDKHSSSLGIHARANFCISGEVIQAIVKFFGPSFVIHYGELDYYFSPVSWADERWTEKLIETLCELARVGILSPNGKMFLPHFEPIRKFIETPNIRSLIDKYFHVELSIPGENGNGGKLYSPLYYASILCETELKALDPPLYNDNQECQFINQKYGWYILTNIWVPTVQELEYERAIIANQLRGFGENGMQTRRGSASCHTIGLTKPESR